MGSPAQWRLEEKEATLHLCPRRTGTQEPTVLPRGPESALQGAWLTPEGSS